MPEEIIKASTLKDIWQALSCAPESRCYLAGGTDLMTAANAGFQNTECWIDISDVKELKEFRDTEKNVFIGAGMKIKDLEENETIKNNFPVLAECFKDFASPTLRSMATLGGNAGNGSPCADGVCALIAEKADIITVLQKEKRRIPLRDFFKGPKRTILEKDELILGFELPKREHTGTYMKLGPRAKFGISKIGIAVGLELNEMRIKDAEICLASVAPTPLCAYQTMRMLTGRKLGRDVIKEAAAMIVSEPSPISDVRSTAEYRRAMCGVLLERSLNSLIRA